MTVRRLAAVGGAGPRGAGGRAGGGWPLPSPSWPLAAPPQRPQRPHPLLDVAGGGGRGLAAHAGGVHGLGGNEVQVLVVWDLI